MLFLTVSLLYKDKPEKRAHYITVHSGKNWIFKAECLRMNVCARDVDTL